MNNYRIKDRFISCKEISKLAWMFDNHISTHDLSMWLKSQTDDKWVVVPKHFCTSMIEFIENEFKEAGITKKWGENQFLKKVKEYL